MASTNQLAAALGLGGLYSTYFFDVNKSKDGQFYWTLHNGKGNTEPFAISEMYKSKQSCMGSIELVKARAVAAAVRDLTVTGLLGS